MNIFNPLKTYFGPIVLIILFTTGVKGQISSIWYDTDQKSIPSAMSGGFLAPQFSAFDMDQDGRNEIITFDRYSGIIQVWGQNDEPYNYVLRQDLQVEWPVINSWMLVRDYDQDGLPDIFTQGFHGIAVYKGFKEKSIIKFRKLEGSSFIDDSLIFHNRSGGTTNIYHAVTDIPIIEDLDGDGDLDILTFELSGSYLYFYENRSEVTGNDLDFTLQHNCWGYFAENQFSEDINLAVDKTTCPPAFSVRHAGSTSCLVDFNHDGLPDLLLGDIGAHSLKVLINSGSPVNGYISEVIHEFPDSETPALLHYFPAAYRIDVDQDSIQDIIVAANEYPLTDDQGLWLYRGTGLPEKPFALHSQEWLLDSHIDLGQYSSPLFIDVNGDGVQDLLVGYQVTGDSFNPVNKIAYFEAVSDLEFQLRDLDFYSLSTELKSGYRPYLTSGDVDGDGDEDILIGMSNGTCYLLFNDSNEGKKFELGRIEKDWAGLQMLFGATPELFDLDGDGDLDVVAGFDNGTIGLYTNIGSSSQAIFDPDLKNPANITSLGQIRTVGDNTLLGRSAPRITTIGQDTLLISGSHNGKLYAYRVESNDLTSAFPAVELEEWPRWVGGNGRISIRQHDSQSVHLLIGNIAGGLTEKYISSVPSNIDKDIPYQFTLFPNPLLPGQNLNILQNHNGPATQVNIYFPTGQLLRSITLSPDQTQISTLGWKPGFYFIQIMYPGHKSIIQKLVVQ